ncbi:hypothetical protein CDAR_242881 [Caerostris darwini]|uniref:Uncharacterized protein n=1 Tax=Caerostris darwini TaxID=1538125 RepID=A0AAV4W9F1_9ARAC|nr:hypothetical protein CDAR_242881 [Caerostris darwini]
MSLHDSGLQAHLHFCQFELMQSGRERGGDRHPKYSNSPYLPPPFTATVSGEERTINSSPTPRCWRGGRLLQNELCHHLVLHSSAEWMIPYYPSSV